jgi:hypothetical protein
MLLNEQRVAEEITEEIKNSLNKMKMETQHTRTCRIQEKQY